MLVSDHAVRKGNARFYGFVPDVLEHLRDMLHFDFRLYLVPDGNFGVRKPDGEWNGMIGEVLAGVR